MKPWLLITALSTAQALHYYTTPGQTRCFYEELTKSSLVVSKIDAAVASSRDGPFTYSDKLSVALTVAETFDADHTVQQQKGPAQGSFAFSSFDSGEHRFCVTPTYADSKAVVRVLFDIVQAGDEIIDSQKKDTVSMVTNKVKEMNNKLQEIKREQELVREREALFRDLSEITNTKAVLYTLVQITVLLSVCYWQLRYLKMFFIKQKVV